MRIRRAVPADAARIAEVHVRSWQGGYRGQLPDALLDALEPAQRIPRWQTTLEQGRWPTTGTLVAEDDVGHRLLGFANLCPTRDPEPDRPDVGEISSFYVDPDRWGGGIGRALMTDCLATLVDAGYRGATLWVLATNVRAIRFYERTGWRADGAVKRDTMAGAPIRDLRYRHALT